VVLNPDVDGYTKTLYHRKILQKTQKTTVLKQNTKTKHKLSGCPIFTLSLPGGRFALCSPVSYAAAIRPLCLQWMLCCIVLCTAGRGQFYYNRVTMHTSKFGSGEQKLHTKHYVESHFMSQSKGSSPQTLVFRNLRLIQ